ncbi:MAG: class B sortase, partial [Bacilli bacterium]|nr:class B sortase [Bacilli bacterium]
NKIFKLSKDTITISKIKKEVDYESLNNTNIIDVKDLKFSNDYIRENFELVSNFLNVIIIKKNIKIAQINNLDIADISLDLINEWEHIEKVYFKPDKVINMDIVLKILDSKHLHEIDCYNMNHYLIERLDLNKAIKVNTRYNYDFVSNFMLSNNLSSYSDFYYKKSISIKKEFDEEEIEDFRIFIALNDRLKHIKVFAYSNELLTTIIEEIIKYKKENIVIEIVEENNDLNMIYNSVAYIKKQHKKEFEEYNITFKLSYSKEYKKRNFLKEINFKLCMSLLIFIILIGLMTVSFSYYKQYRDEQKINEQIEEFENIISEAEEFITIDNNESDVEYIGLDKNTTTTTTTKKNSNYKSAYYVNYSQAFQKLLKKNDDTVGWLEVNNTRIKYPVVQSETNSYYLNRDFNKKKNSMGWIFMDYRNNPVDLDKNTIIYGHNIKTGIMFGTIKTMFNSSWYKKASNQIITFNTPIKNMKWKIFSIYQIKATEDYLKHDFDNNEEYLKFIDMIKKRSIYNFKVDVKETDKIITLSTCYSHTTRHVIHAVLVEEEDSIED